MIKENNKIILFPSNWLYNAGVVGLKLLDVLEGINKISFSGNTAELPERYFDFIDVNRRFFGQEKTLKVSIVGKSNLYPNFINSSRIQDKNNFHLYLKSIKRIKKTKKNCSICSSNLGFSKERLKTLNKVWSERNNDFDTFYYGINEFSNKFDKQLGGAQSLFPNGFWNFNTSTYVCPVCSIILIHHHLGLTTLSDFSEIFINAPSFKVMYELNKFVKESFGANSKIENRTKREILATTVIEYANKIQTSLGIWSGMNIEIITKKNKSIEYFTLPYNVVKIITDRQIASILSDLGEYNIYNKILDEKYSDLIDLAQKFLRLSIKDQLNKSEQNYINNTLFLQKNRNHLKNTANKILKLYSLIEDKIKRR